MNNKHTAEVSFNHSGVKGTLVYDWRALALVHSNFDDEFLVNIYKASPDKVALLAAIGFKKLNPEIDVEYLMDKSPPIQMLIRAIDTALLYANWGAEEGARFAQAAEIVSADIDEVKKKMKRPKKTT